jgi:hypothetical protein
VESVRIALMLAVAAAYAAAISTATDPGAMALGLAPLAWVAFEGCWRLLTPRP